MSTTRIVSTPAAAPAAAPALGPRDADVSTRTARPPPAPAARTAAEKTRRTIAPIPASRELRGIAAGGASGPGGAEPGASNVRQGVLEGSTVSSPGGMRGGMGYVPSAGAHRRTGRAWQPTAARLAATYAGPGRVSARTASALELLPLNP